MEILKKSVASICSGTLILAVNSGWRACLLLENKVSVQVQVFIVLAKRHSHSTYMVNLMCKFASFGIYTISRKSHQPHEKFLPSQSHSG